MLAKLELKLKCDGTLNYQMSSLFHGVLMEMLSEEYAGYLHTSNLHPYAQHLEFRANEWYWVVCCLNKTAVRTIIYDTLMPLDRIELKKKKLKIDIVEKNYEEVTYKALTEEFYEKDSSRYIKVHFTSPTAFKQNGRYLFYPQLRCVFQSLMNKYDAATVESVMADEESLEELCEKAQIVQYDLKSVAFFLEGVKIPAFIGKITIRMHHSQTMANFVNMLFEFGEYSGVGIKTALGMGNIKLIRGEET